MARILIVEDDPSIALGLEDDLRLEGYEVEVITDGGKASQRIREREFDLILLDIMLPHKDGFEICREIRRNNIPARIILLTAKSEESDKLVGLDTGADDYVVKPFSPRELRARIRAVLRRGETTPPAVYRFGETEVDFSKGQVRRSGVAIDLTNREFRLLGSFIRARGRVLTRDYLLSEVWGSDVFIGERVVDNHITNLRKKIESDPSQPRYLVSVRGIGYRFDA